MDAKMQSHPEITYVSTAGCEFQEARPFDLDKLGVPGLSGLTGGAEPLTGRSAGPT